MGSRFTLDRGCGGQVSGISEATWGRDRAYTAALWGYRAHAALWQPKERSRPTGPCQSGHDFEVFRTLASEEALRVQEGVDFAW